MSNQEIVVVERGGIFIARFAGKPNRVFGATAKDVISKIKTSDWCAAGRDGSYKPEAVHVYAGPKRKERIAA